MIQSGQTGQTSILGFWGLGFRANMKFKQHFLVDTVSTSSAVKPSNAKYAARETTNCQPWFHHCKDSNLVTDSKLFTNFSPLRAHSMRFSTLFLQ